jgi:hypothetical protein
MNLKIKIFTTSYSMKFIRITIDNIDALRKFCGEVPAYACLEGPDDECKKDHYHVLLDTDITDNGVRKQIYKHFDVSKENRGQKSCVFTKITDVEGVKRYISKGVKQVMIPQPPPRIVINTMNLDVEIYHNAFFVVNASLIKDKKDKKATSASRTKEFNDYFVDNHITMREGHRRLTSRDICAIMLRYYREKKYPLPPRWHGTSMVMTLYSNYSEDPQKEKCLINYYGFGELKLLDVPTKESYADNKE